MGVHGNAHHDPCAIALLQLALCELNQVDELILLLVLLIQEGIGTPLFDGCKGPLHFLDVVHGHRQKHDLGRIGRILAILLLVHEPVGARHVVITLKGAEETREDGCLHGIEHRLLINLHLALKGHLGFELALLLAHTSDPANGIRPTSRRTIFLVEDEVVCLQIHLGGVLEHLFWGGSVGQDVQ